MDNVLKLLAVAASAYLIGSIPFALIVTRWRSGVDVRSVGSGHAGATNTMRAAGWAAGILVMILDLAKGYAAVRLALLLGGGWEWAVVPAVGLAVIGHCWPLLAGFRGGMGMASTGGASLALWPFGFVVSLGVAVLAQLLVRHSARANLVTGLLLGPLWALLGAPLPWVYAIGAAGLVVAVRATSDWNRVYRELWLDREV